MNSRRGLNPRKEPYCKICELYLARADAAHSPKASTGNASVAGTPLVNAIMLRASWMCLICSLYFLQDHEDCRDEQYCVDELDEAFTADVAVRDVSQQGAERKERQRRQDKLPWHAGQLVAHDNICNDEHVECRPDGDQRSAERSFVLQLLSRVDDDGWTTRGERSLHGASDEQQGVEKPHRPWLWCSSAWPELRDQSLDADDDHEDGEDVHQRGAWQDIIGDHANRKSGQDKCKDAQVLPPVDVLPGDDQKVDVQEKGQDSKDGASSVDAGQEDAERHGQHGAAEAGDPLDEMGRQDDEAKQDSSQGKGHIFLHASSRGAPEQYTRNAAVGSSTRAEASAPVRVCLCVRTNHTVLEPVSYTHLTLPTIYSV